MCTCAHEFTCMWRPEVDTGCLPLIALYLSFLRQGLSLNLNFINGARLDGLWAPGNLLYPVPAPGLQTCCFYVGAGDLNSGPHTCPLQVRYSKITESALMIRLDAASLSS